MSLHRRLVAPQPFDLAATWFAILGPGGNTTESGRGVFRLAAHNEAGEVELALHMERDKLVAEASGPGAAADLETVPRLVGFNDEPDVFAAGNGLVAQLSRRNRGLRLGATGRIFDVLAPTILGQRVTSGSAKESYRSLVKAFGEPAPGPGGLRLPPHPSQLAGLDYEEMHRHGIERSRAVILREAARRAKRLEEALSMDRESAYSRLEAIRGIGPWTSGHVMGVAWGDRDAVPIGDFHLPNTVAWLLAGEPRAGDQRMLDLLEPYRPQRRRVVVLLKKSRAGAPKYGPKSPVQDIRPN